MGESPVYKTEQPRRRPQIAIALDVWQRLMVYRANSGRVSSTIGEIVGEAVDCFLAQKAEQADRNDHATASEI